MVFVLLYLILSDDMFSDADIINRYDIKLYILFYVFAVSLCNIYKTDLIISPVLDTFCKNLHKKVMKRT